MVTLRFVLRAALAGAGLAFALALAAAAVAVAAPPPIIKIDNRKFDHDKHAQVSAAAGKPASCASCHTFDASGARKPGREHPRCAQCHTYPRSCDLMKTPGPKGQARVCQVCHTPTSTRCLPPDLPPPPKADSFQARFTHGKHLTLGPAIEKDCVQCHPAQGTGERPKATAHALCAGCHNPNGVRPPMTDCQGCHQAPRAKTPPAADPYRLGGFDHRAHHTVSRQASCLGCHDKLTGAGEAALPRPSMEGCVSRCHDGTKAFLAVGTRCTTCHKGRDAVAPVRQDMSFTHAAHAGRKVNIGDCGMCHEVEADGRLTAPLAKKNHQPCAQGGCHLKEFMSRTTKICGICHEAASPWQKTTSRAKPAPKPEWFERIDHASHLGKLGALNNACAACHGNKLAGEPEPRGHDACAPCHGTGQTPSMSQCASCHTQAPPPRAEATVWSVRATFDHKQHGSDPRARGAPTKCTECHKQIAAAKDMASIQPPKMADCEGCHDGRYTFKTTGFDCARCHTPAGAAQPTASVSAAPAHIGAGLAVNGVTW